MKKWYEDNTQDMLRDIRVPKDTSLTDTERKQVQEFIDKYKGTDQKFYTNPKYSEDANLLEQAKQLIYGIEYFRSTNIKICITMKKLCRISVTI